MAILISPTNNTGWGLGLGNNKLFGGAVTRSDEHPVYVKAHYRASWGSRTRSRRTRRVRRARVRVSVPMDPVTAAQVAETIDEVARNGPPASRTVVEVAPRSGSYNLRRSRRLTPAGRALMLARFRRTRRRRR
ncbi:core protein [Equine adenovirus 1]|uniref:Core protein n=1 Tax=Equine adenovirus A serotype 1 TaxID=46916 RepID=G5CZ83_ADEE1|nr:core protein [Equine adenovirus 1]AEP16414.1 core protein [Equine adenovirus 1]ANG08559.1 core protein [Equine adenovirus 1]